VLVAGCNPAQPSPVFSQLARSVLRHISVESKDELKDRLMAMDYFNQQPVVHTRSFKFRKAG
jgi:hypothetical protein